MKESILEEVVPIVEIPLSKPIRHLGKNTIDSQEEASPSIDEKAQNFRNKEKDSRRLHKSNLMRLSELGEEEPRSVRSLSSIKRAKEKARRRNMIDTAQVTKVYREIILSGPMIVSEAAHAMSEKVVDVVRALMDLGVFAKANETIDADTIEIVATSLGHSVKRVAQDLGIQGLIQNFNDKNEELLEHPPVVSTFVNHCKVFFWKH